MWIGFIVNWKTCEILKIIRYRYKFMQIGRKSREWWPLKTSNLKKIKFTRKKIGLLKKLQQIEWKLVKKHKYLILTSNFI